MPLRLKHLELHGYKTFAARTDFSFGPGVSAIVGPNGSGKSNVVDSIRWVLGEQSFGLLRGKKTEDMIFAGSETRPRAGMAQAQLTFDNSDGWLPIEFSEVTVGRRAYRDGQNEYLLNGQRVRLRDLTELLSKCGLAERTYTIIGQGLIDTALSLKADERRALFEEAAGIGVYRHKREDALKKLDATQRNLERVLDILAEIKPRLRSLERQAQRARDYQQVKADLDGMLRIWYGYHWHRAVEELEQARLAAEAAAAELAEGRAEQSASDEAVASLRARLTALRAQIGGWRGLADQLRTQNEALARELAVADERLRSLADQRAALAAEVPGLEAQAAELAERIAAARADAERLLAEADDAERQAADAEKSLADQEAQRAALHRREADARTGLAQSEAQLADLRARRAHLIERRGQLAAAQTEQQSVIAELQAAEAEARSRARQATVELDRLQHARAEAEARAETQRLTIREAESHRLDASERLADMRASGERLRARQEVLEQARAEMTSFAAGVRALLQSGLPARGIVSELIQVPVELEAAIGAALGPLLEALVVDDTGDLDRTVEAVSASGGRATLLPLARLAASEPLQAPADPDCLGVASQLIAAEAELRRVMDLLLGQVVIVRDRAAAERILSGLPRQATAVTLQGEAFHAAGPVTLGREAATSTLQQARERRDLTSEFTAFEGRLTHLEAELAEAARLVGDSHDLLFELEEAVQRAVQAERRSAIARDSLALEAERAAHEVQLRREQLDALTRELAAVDTQQAAAQESLAALEAARGEALARVQAAEREAGGFSAEAAAVALARWRASAAAARRAAQDAGRRADEQTQAHLAAAGRLEDQHRKIAALESDSRAIQQDSSDGRERERTLAGQLAELSAQLTPALSQLGQLEAEQSRLEASDAGARTALHAVERANAQAQLEHVRKNEEMATLRRRIEEDFGLVELDYGDSDVTAPTPLPLYPIVEKLERLDSLPDGLEEQLNRKRGQLRRMGAINPDADREYAEVQERHAFLTTQVADLEAAQAQLREIIAEMDVLMERDFRKTFDAVANEFRDTFVRLFGGGGAKLVLTDPDHLSTSGVDIQARLPGRRVQGLAMLSGGERSLTACALVFALLRVSPTPFCVLDEVDAMLDEANVSRYREMLSELSQQTQFIIVTHNRNTVQVADTVYGVTMGSDTASQVIGLKLDGEPAAAPAPAQPQPG